MLTILFANYQKHLTAWLATGQDGDISIDTIEFENLDTAEQEFVRHQCSTPEEALEKVRLALDNRELFETIQNDRGADGKLYLRVYLQSLIPPVDKSNNGDN